MKKASTSVLIRIIVIMLTFLNFYTGVAQGVGINSTGAAPHANALLHVDAGADITKGLLVTGNSNNASIPDLGSGSRLMFYPGKGIFRAGAVDGSRWDNANVGSFSAAVGINTTAKGYASFAAGNNTTANAFASTALGSNTTAFGNLTTAMGENTTANAYGSTAMGSYTRANGSFSTAMGDNTIANGYSSTVVGMYNEPVLAEGAGAPAINNPLFIVGNGGSNSTRSNAMVINKKGDVGIGKNNPFGRVHVRANSTLEYAQMHLEEEGNDFSRLTFTNAATSNFWTIAASPQATSASAVLNFYFNTAGDVFSLKGNGNATLAGTLTQNSDARLKKNIKPITNAMHQLKQVNGYHYYWQNKLLDPTMQTGILAQEIKEVFPELVKTDATGTLSVNYSGLIPYVIEAAKEQQQEIEDLKTRLQKLEEMVQRLTK